MKCQMTFFIYFLEVDECSQGSHGCLSNLAVCRNTAGSYSCICNAGLVGDGMTSCLPEGKTPYDFLTLLSLT